MIARRSLVTLVLTGGLVVGISAVATAQSPAVPPRRMGELDPARVTMLRNRYHVRQMESVLVRAVEHAAEVMTHRLTTVSPDVMALAGVPRAQGFRIDGYGLFFAVEVPRLSDSMNWALQVLGNSQDARTLTSLQRLVETQTDPVLRADLERAIRSLQRHMALGVPPDVAGAAGRREVGPQHTPAGRQLPVAVSATPSSTLPAPADETALDTSLISNPSAAYEDEVKAALGDALLDYALTLPLVPGQFVTVAARDAGYIAFPDAAAEMVTVTLSVKVDDLLEMRAQRIDRDEARRRILVREF